MGSVKFISYNCQAAAWKNRMHSILLTLSFASVLGLQGTRTRRQRLQTSDSEYWTERVNYYDVVHWHAADEAFSNSSTGVTLAVDRRYFHSIHRAAILSPGKSLQGRGGAVLYTKPHAAFLFVSLYFPTGSPSEKDHITAALLEWFGQVLASLPPRTHVYVMMDANATFGYEKQNRQLFFQRPRVVGPLSRDISNSTGQILAAFLAAHHLVLANTFIGQGSPTYWGWHGNSSRIDYVAISDFDLPTLSCSSVLTDLGFKLQLSRCSTLRDHSPVLIQTNAPNAFRRQPINEARWDWNKLCMPRLYEQDIQKFLNTTQSWASDPEVDKQMQKLALAGDINSAWRFLQKGIRQHSATFQASTSHRKYPPSEATIYWQDQKEQARRLGRELLLVASLYDDPALLDVLRGWHFVAHRQYSDKQLGKSKRIDQETARKHWNEELIRAKARGDARTAQRLIYKIAGTGISKHKQFSWQTPSTNPSLGDWIRLVRKNGPDGGCSAKIVCVQDALDDSCIARLEGVDTMMLNLSCGGGTGMLRCAPSSVPLSILKKSYKPDADFVSSRANQDLKWFAEGLRQGRSGRAVPPWSIPKELWKLLMHGTRSCRPPPAVKRLVWLLFYSLRQAGEPPLLWNVSFGIPIPKGNHKPGVRGRRIIHLLDPVGKCWFSRLWQSRSPPTHELSFGFEKHKRKEQAVLIQRLAQFRAVSRGLTWFFIKWDVANAFPSISHDSVDGTVRLQQFDKANEDIVRDRYRRSYTVLTARGGQVALYKNRSGVLQGDCGAPQKFSGTYNSTIGRWHCLVHQYTARSKHPVLNVEDSRTDSLHTMTTTVFADDLGRSGTAWSYRDLNEQHEYWNRSLDASLREVGLEQNSSKRSIVVSSPSLDFRREIDHAQGQLRTEIKPAVEYLGSLLHCTGDSLPEIRKHIHESQVAWAKLGPFWSRRAIPTRYRTSAYCTMVRSVMLTGLETLAFTWEMLHKLETVQTRFLRKICCGMACEKRTVLDDEGNERTKYTAKSNETVRQMLKVPTVASELRARRLRWLQQMVLFPEKSRSTLAALVGQSYWEPDSPIDNKGNLTSASSPWLLQFFDDLDALAKVNSLFRKDWSEFGWNAVYRKAFCDSSFAVLKSYREFDKSSIRIHTVHLPGMQKSKPYTSIDPSTVHPPGIEKPKTWSRWVPWTSDFV